MAHLLDGGSDTFDALVYGRPHPGTLQFLESQATQVSHHLSQAGQQFMAGAYDLWDRINGSTAMRVMRAAARAGRSLWQTDEIRALTDIGEIQYAPLKMQRWIMAEPTLRKLYNKQSCAGYEGTYLDAHPGDIGEGHYDWRRVMNGMVQVDEDTGLWHADEWSEELLPDDSELTLEDQVDVLDTWNILRDHLTRHRDAEGIEDPTSVWGATLG